VARLNEEEQRLTQERARLFKDQERIRANIESLKSGASRRELAERFVATCEAGPGDRDAHPRLDGCAATR
jgi:hypothetical protein